MSTVFWLVGAWAYGGVTFLLGCWWVRWVSHAPCRAAFRDQQDYIDYLEAGGDVVAEAEDLLREPGS